MKSSTLTTTLTSLLLIASINYPLSAQTSKQKVTPRFTLQHDSSGGGFDGITQFGGFVPLMQEEGKNLLYFNGRLSLDNDAQFGANALLGYRQYIDSANRIYGGYIGYDNRDTSRSNFNQLSFGLESLGKIWDFNINGYLPVGKTRYSLDSFVGQTEVVNPRFVDHYLLFDTTQSTYNTYESAVAGFDVTTGAKLTNIGEKGALRAYAGLYYLSTEGNDNALGWRIRLNAEANDNLAFGVSLQDDNMFGTNAVFTVALGFPGSRPKAFKDDPDSVLGRFGSLVLRNPTILVDEQLEKVLTEYFDVKAINPNTDQPWYFNHVVLGQGNSDGSIEHYYHNIEEALATIPKDGNGIIYVRSGDGSVIPQFTIPAQVQILSTGVLQYLPLGNPEVFTALNPNPEGVTYGCPTGLICLQIPESGTGIKPTINGSLIMENGIVSDTVISGFKIQSPDGVGIQVEDSVKGNVEIRDNEINAVEKGIAFDLTDGASTGDITIRRNNITVTPVVLNQEKISRQASAIPLVNAGIDLNFAEGAGLTGNITIDQNTITVVTAEGAEGSIGPVTGVLISAPEGGLTLTGDVSITDNTITLQPQVHYSYDASIGLGLITGTANLNTFLSSPSSSNTPASTITGNVTVTGNEVSIDTNNTSNGNQGPSIGYSLNNGILIGLDHTTLTGDVTTSDNQVTLSHTNEGAYSYVVFDDGIGVYLNESTVTGDLNLLNNQINITQSLNSSLTPRRPIPVNLVGNLAQGINIQANTSEVQGNLTLADNTISIDSTNTVVIDGGEGQSVGISIPQGISLRSTQTTFSGDVNIDHNTVTLTNTTSSSAYDVAALSYSYQGQGLTNPVQLGSSGISLAGINVIVADTTVEGDLSIDNNQVNVTNNLSIEGAEGAFAITAVGINLAAKGKGGTTFNGDVSIDSNQVTVANNGQVNFPILNGPTAFMGAGGIISNLQNITLEGNFSINDNNVTVTDSQSGNLDFINGTTSVAEGGIYVVLNPSNDLTQDVEINRNTVSLKGIDGAEGFGGAIVFVSSDTNSTTLDAMISKNQVTSNSVFPAIGVYTLNTANVKVTADTNTLNSSPSPSFEGQTANASTLCLTLTNNTTNNNFVLNNTGGTFGQQNSGNTGTINTSGTVNANCNPVTPP